MYETMFQWNENMYIFSILRLFYNVIDNKYMATLILPCSGLIVYI